jgi:hypothetical protein
MIIKMDVLNGLVLLCSSCEEDDNEIDIEREFERLLEILKVCI